MIINKYILDIYVINPWKILFSDLRFLEVYNNIHQASKKMEWNIDKKPLGFRLCVVVSVWVYGGGYVCTCGCVFLG